MNNKAALILAASVLVNLALLSVVNGQDRKIAVMERNLNKYRAWSRIMKDVIGDHLDGGGTIKRSPRVDNDIAAYLLFDKNGLL